jgi:outer membrane protein assembly factor BamA
MSATLAMARRVLLSPGVRASLVAVALACRAPAPAPLPPPCDPMRVGRVIVDGAAASEVAPLKILEGTWDDPARTARIADVATEQLRGAGYARATIAIARVPSCGVDLHVAVARGPRFRIARIDFVGDDAGLARVAALEDALGRVNAIGGTYSEARMIRALAALRRSYRDAGWIDAAIDRPRAELDAERGDVRVAIAVHPGRRFRVGVVRARGAGARARATVVEALGLRGGDWYDARVLRAGIDRARRELDRAIELHATVDDDRDEVDVEALLGDAR